MLCCAAVVDHGWWCSSESGVPGKQGALKQALGQCAATCQAVILGHAVRAPAGPQQLCIEWRISGRGMRGGAHRRKCSVRRPSARTSLSRSATSSARCGPDLRPAPGTYRCPGHTKLTSNNAMQCWLGNPALDVCLCKFLLSSARPYSVQMCAFLNSLLLSIIGCCPSRIDCASAWKL